MDLYEKNKEMKQFFNEKSENYDLRHKELGLMDNKLKITEYLNDDLKHILDLGVGSGLELIPLFKRFPNVNIKLFPAAVQGTGAAETICDGIKFFNDNSLITFFFVIPDKKHSINKTIYYPNNNKYYKYK